MTANTSSTPEACTHTVTLKKRSHFLALRGSPRFSCSAFTLQSKALSIRSPSGSALFGYTVTKRQGNAVERNRIKRRLREVVRSVAPGRATRGRSYVLIARREALYKPFEDLIYDLKRGLKRQR
ncbi:MAG: ribonuclease P protein component [Pseudomonadota bacterium]